MTRNLKLFAWSFASCLTLLFCYMLIGSAARVFADGSSIISTGTFTSNGIQTGNSIPAGATASVADFEAYISDTLSENGGYGTPGNDYNAYGAAFIVETMLNGKHNYAANNALLNQARSDYALWASYVTAYGKIPGAVRFNVPTTLPGGSTNSYHNCDRSNCKDEDVYTNDGGRFVPPLKFFGTGRDGNAFTFYTTSKSEASTLIIFTNPDGTTFSIREECGNVVGEVSPLQPPNRAPTGSLSASCTNDGEVKMTVSDPDGATDGYIKVAGTQLPTHPSGTTYILSNYAVTQPSWGSVTIDLYVKDSGPAGSGAYNYITSVNLGPCGQVTCSTSSLSSLTDGFASSFHVSMTFSGASSPPPGAKFNISITGPNSQTYSGVGSTTSGSTIQSSPDSSFTPHSSGSYTLSWTYYGKSCPGGTIIAYDEPYFTATGGDVMAGSGFGPGCTNDPTASIKAFNGGSPTFVGAATTLAALAPTTISGFATGTDGTNGNNTAVSGVGQPYALTFANTGTPGNYGSAGCVPNYAADALSKSTVFVNNAASSVDPSALASGTYVFNNNGGSVFTINPGGSSTIPADHHITLIINSDTLIKKDINYGPYADLTHAPQLTIIVNGANLYIDKNVQNLSGFYIAEPQGNQGGIVVTCTLGNNESINSPQCDTPLTIYGAVSAGMIHLDRTYGNIGATNPVENIIFSPELWVGGANGCTNDSTQCTSEYQSITSLPPVL